LTVKSNHELSVSRENEARYMLLSDAMSCSIQHQDYRWRKNFPEIIGESQNIRDVLKIIMRVANTDSAVLILGESGTGKELIASAIHRLSKRAARKLVTINCSAIPENLLEAELFGHEKGAFTGAINKRVGLFEQAYGGTLFLDEIGDMPLNLQAKILRVLQEKSYTPIGSSQSKQANVRILAATHQNLESLVKEKCFRLDLYYRLNVFPIKLPALRERKEDIKLLLMHFLDQRNHQKKSCYFSQEIFSFLEKYAWPGNIRQLQNLVERLFIMHDAGIISVDNLPDEYRSSEGVFLSIAGKKIDAPPLKSHTRINHSSSSFIKLPFEGLNLPSLILTLENDLIMQALERTRFNKNQAAKLLKLNRTTLVEKIKKRKLIKLCARQAV